MSNKIFKNYQVNLGLPFQIGVPVNFDSIRKMNAGKYKEYIEEGLSYKDVNHDEKSEQAEEIIENARKEAERIINEAKIEAARIIKNAEAEANSSRLFIEEESRQKGYLAGLNEAKHQYEGLIHEAEQIVEATKNECKKVLDNLESDAVSMVVDIAKKVIGLEINSNREYILSLVKQAFEKCSNKENIVLKVSSEDYDFLLENKEKLLSMVECMDECEIKKDYSLKPGACIIETPYGIIDSSIQTKIKKIEEVFKHLMRE